MTSQEITRQYLRSQYKDSSNFMARVRLHANYSTNAYGWTRWAFDQFDAPLDAHVLELGAGPGILWVSNAQRIPAGWKIVLSDYSPGMVTEQRHHLQAILGSFHFGIIDAQNLPFADSVFDMVTANHMLYHVPNIPGALNEIRRVLKPGGKFYAGTNGVHHMLELDELVARYSGTNLEQRPTLSFTLENGAEIIAPVFPDVTLRYYEDALAVTEVEALVAYVLSGRLYRTDRISESPDKFREFLRQEMRKTGAIHIRKDAGMFVTNRT